MSVPVHFVLITTVNWLQIVGETALCIEDMGDVLWLGVRKEDMGDVCALAGSKEGRYGRRMCSGWE